jgi:hypothetical protein
MLRVRMAASRQKRPHSDLPVTRLHNMQTAARRDDSRLKRLYRSIEDSIVETDDILREHTATLKSERKRDGRT